MAAFHVHVTAAKQNVDGLEDAADEVVGRWQRLHPDAVQLALDKDRASPVERLSVVALALLCSTTRDECPLLAEVEARGAERLGHRKKVLSVQK